MSAFRTRCGARNRQHQQLMERVDEAQEVWQAREHVWEMSREVVESATDLRLAWFPVSASGKTPSEWCLSLTSVRWFLHLDRLPQPRCSCPLPYPSQMDRPVPNTNMGCGRTITSAWSSAYHNLKTYLRYKTSSASVSRTATLRHHGSFYSPISCNRILLTSTL
jgi:hypothetical protein